MLCRSFLRNSAASKAYGKYSGTEIKVNGKALLIMRESDVLAKIG